MTILILWIMVLDIIMAQDTIRKEKREQVFILFRRLYHNPREHSYYVYLAVYIGCCCPNFKDFLAFSINLH